MNQQINNKSHPSLPSSKPSVIQKDIHLKGEINFEGEFHIYGKVSGNIAANIKSHGMLVIHKGAVIEGQIQAPLILIAGTVIGDIFASTQLTVKATANIEGNIHYCALNMKPGASLTGTLSSLQALE